MDDNRIDPGHDVARDALRVLGPIIGLVGLGFTITGVVDFFHAFGGFEPPHRFWCAFVGLPLMFVGLVMTSYGFMGKIIRYQAQEMAPPAKDTFNYMADGTKDGIKTVAGAVAEGVREGLAGKSQSGVRCQGCGTANLGDARFCIQCGRPLTKSRKCPNCNELNDPHANFCQNCGHAFQ
jgi:hypothetical protein